MQDTMTIDAPAASLAQQLVAFQQQLGKNLPPDVMGRLSAAIERMIESRPGTAALHSGQPAPDFTLQQYGGGSFTLADALRDGPLVLTFYRGSWCPYCDLQLRAYSKILPALREQGVQFAAVSPQSADAAVPNAAEHGSLGFPVLVDAGNAVARRFGLVYDVADDMRAVLNGFGLDLTVVNGSPAWEVPVPATFVIGRDRRIRWAHVDADYRRRAEPADILRAVQGA
jgi:peroxiredoxin